MCDNWLWVEMLQHTVWNYIYVHWVNLQRQESEHEPQLWTSFKGPNAFFFFSFTKFKNIPFKAVLQNTTNSKDMWRGGGGSLTPDILRVASLGHQFLDVICSLGACHATEFLGYLVEGSLYVPSHVTCISGRKAHLIFHEQSTLNKNKSLAQLN